MNVNSIFFFFFFFEEPKGPMINQSLWKKPIVLQERSVSRTRGKKHQTKPPAFTESVGPAAPSLERVHVLPSQHRPHFFRWHRSRHCAKKIARGRESYQGDTCARGYRRALRMHCPFTGNSGFFCGSRTYE